MAFRRITKREAKKRFVDGKLSYLCPCKLYPSGAFNVALGVLSGKEYMEKAESYRGNPALWQGTVEETAWQLMYNDWSFYNCTHETGYYAHYYVESST